MFLSPGAEPWVLFLLVQVLAARHSVDKVAAAVGLVARKGIVDFQAAENQQAHIVEAHQAVHTAVVPHMGMRTVDLVDQLAADIGVGHCA